MAERDEPPREEWLTLADLARVPAAERESCAWAFRDTWDVTAGWWPPPMAELMPLDPGRLARLTTSLQKMIGAIEALSPAEHLALARQCGLASDEFAQLAELARRLAAGAIRIVPRSASGRGRPPKRVRRPILKDEATITLERGLQAGEVITAGETLLLGLAEWALEHGGAFTFHRKGEAGGTIIEARRRLQRYMPTGFELPKAARIDELLTGLDRARKARDLSTDQ